MVLCYSELYMQGYPIIKFFYETTSFYSVIILLVLRSSIFNLMFGWDWLGITSILLILFYPSFSSLINSNLTMYFNRVGDIFMILLFSLFVLSPYDSWFSSLKLARPLYMVLICVCIMAKSAQFPLSRWLPAAIRAPTPISAIVHSSTLVTAGIFLVLRSFWVFDYSNNTILFALFSLTFIISGFMANHESDLKKTIAFSTISQIRMILFFLISFKSFFSLGSCHMVYHAFFKTSIFCLAGFLFSFNFNPQSTKNLLSSSNIYLFSCFCWLSIFCITGLFYSSSFYSKHYSMDFLFFNLSCLGFLLVVASVLTVIYCSKIINSFKLKRRFFPFQDRFIGTTWSFSLFILFIAFCQFFFSISDSKKLFRSLDLLWSSLLFLTVLVGLKSFTKMGSSFSSNLSFMSNFTYRFPFLRTPKDFFSLLSLSNMPQINSAIFTGPNTPIKDVRSIGFSVVLFFCVLIS